MSNSYNDRNYNNNEKSTGRSWRDEKFEVNNSNSYNKYNGSSRYSHNKSGGYDSSRTSSWHSKPRDWTPGNFESTSSFSSKPELPPVPFKKNFYQTSRQISDNEAANFRHDHDIKVAGDVPNPFINFEDAGWNSQILNNFKMKGFSAPTPIQAQGWPIALTGNDMVGIAQTGSGKTLSFVLPALIHAKAQEPLRSGDGPIVLVLAPTRELCLQIKDVFDEYSRFYNLKCTAVYGGVSSYQQKKDLSMGCEIVIGCPGRLIDLNEQGFCHFGRVTFLVLDEADRMLDMGFEPQLKKIICKANPERQTLMWSATWPREVRRLAEVYMKNYSQLTIGSEDLKTNFKIKQVVEVVDWREKNPLLYESLKSKGNSKIIIFSNTKRNCDKLEDDLNQKGFKAVAIHGDKSQNIRDRIIRDFRSGYKNILIATDVAARGLDIKDVVLVINYDFPNNIEDYVHRIGRTARGNVAEGESLSFFTYENRGCARELIRMLKVAKQDVPYKLNEMANSAGSGSSSGYNNRSRVYKSYY